MEGRLVDWSAFEQTVATQAVCRAQDSGPEGHSKSQTTSS